VRHPQRFVGAFMFNWKAPETEARIDHAFGELDLRTACLFPAMHGYQVDDEAVAAVCRSAERYGRAVFVHCGLLSVGVRKKLGLPSRFDLRNGDPLAVAAIALRYPGVPFVIPHFGAGLFRSADGRRRSAEYRADTSSSNSWIKFNPGLTLRRSSPGRSIARAEQAAVRHGLVVLPRAERGGLQRSRRFHRPGKRRRSPASVRGNFANLRLANLFSPLDRLGSGCHCTPWHLCETFRTAGTDYTAELRSEAPERGARFPGPLKSDGALDQALRLCLLPACLSIGRIQLTITSPLSADCRRCRPARAVSGAEYV
jgi:hypothetical protein